MRRSETEVWHSTCTFTRKQVMEPCCIRRRFLRESAVPLLAFFREEAGARHSRRQAYRITSAGHVLRVAIEFFDDYRAEGLRFLSAGKGNSFCLSSSGQQNRECVQSFWGAMAIAEYRLEAHAANEPMSLVETVRTVDGDFRLPIRPLFQRRIMFERGVASDIQAFGYEKAETARAARELWCVLRQDLSWKDGDAPFLVLHWKHSPAAIRLLDVIPTNGTRLAGGAETG